MSWEKRAPGVWVEPILVAREEEISHLAGSQRKRESSEEYLRRIGRIRQLFRAEEAVDRVESLVVDMAQWPKRPQLDVVRRSLDDALYGRTS